MLSEEDALRLLARFRYPREDERDAAEDLVADVGVHTLALTLIGEQLREAPGGYTGALAKLRATGRLDRIEALARLLQPLLGEKARGILATFEMSIAALDADARALLGVAAVCAPNEPIPVPLLAACVTDEDEFASALSRLLRASLLNRRRDREQGGEPVEIHPLVADVMLRRLPMPAEELADALARPLLRLVNTAGDILTHDQALADAMRQTRHFASWLQSKVGLILGLQLGHYYYARGLYQLARVANERAQDLAVRLLGDRHPDTLTSMSDFATTLLQQDELVEARLLQEHVLASRRELLGEKHPDTLMSVNNLAATLFVQRELVGARALLEEALDGLREVLGERHPDTLWSMNGLAETLIAQGELAGARALLKPVLASRCELLGNRHPDTTLSAWNLFATLSKLNAAEEVARVRNDQLAWLLDAADEDISGQQRQIRDWLRAQGDASHEAPD